MFWLLKWVFPPHTFLCMDLFFSCNMQNIVGCMFTSTCQWETLRQNAFLITLFSVPSSSERWSKNVQRVFFNSQKKCEKTVKLSNTHFISAEVIKSQWCEIIISAGRKTFEVHSLEAFFFPATWFCCIFILHLWIPALFIWIYLIFILSFYSICLSNVKGSPMQHYQVASSV